MLKSMLREKMLPEYRILYDCNVKLSDSELKTRIRDSVRQIRKNHTHNGINKLESKLEHFGNGGGWYRDRVKDMVKRLYSEKDISKNSIGGWRSIEFELIFNSKKACDDFGYAIRATGLGGYVTIKDDMSIKRSMYDSAGIPHEVVFSYEVGHEDNVRKFCECLKGRAYVTESCGTHFHIDVRHLDIDGVLTYGNRLAAAVPELRLLLPHARRNNKYCQKDINSIHDNCVSPQKYAFINLASYNKHKTIEVRGHSGTINAEKILNWIAVCEKIMVSDYDYKTAVEAPLSGTAVPVSEWLENRLIKRYSLDNKLGAYVRQRAALFDRQKTEGEEKSEEKIAVPIHPVFLIPVPPAKEIQPGV